MRHAKFHNRNIEIDSQSKFHTKCKWCNTTALHNKCYVTNYSPQQTNKNDQGLFIIIEISHDLHKVVKGDNNYTYGKYIINTEKCIVFQLHKDVIQ